MQWYNRWNFRYFRKWRQFIIYHEFSIKCHDKRDNQQKTDGCKLSSFGNFFLFYYAINKKMKQWIMPVIPNTWNNRDVTFGDIDRCWEFNGIVFQQADMFNRPQSIYIPFIRIQEVIIHIKKNFHMDMAVNKILFL